MTPSEVVLLDGERFAGKRLVGNVRLLHADRKVAADELAVAVLTAAFLANDERDAVRFETGDLPRWFGLRSRRALFVGRETPPWPRDTLEWAVPSFLAELTTGEHRDRAPVGALVDSFFDGDRADPWRYVVDLVTDGLAARGLLDRRPERVFRLDTGRIEYDLPASIAQLTRETAPEPIERLFGATQTARPDVWELLQWEIERAVSAHGCERGVQLLSRLLLLTETRRSCPDDEAGSNPGTE